MFCNIFCYYNFIKVLIIEVLKHIEKITLYV